MAARLAPDHVRRMHQSLHRLVADAPWSDEEMLGQVKRARYFPQWKGWSGGGMDRR